MQKSNSRLGFTLFETGVVLVIGSLVVGGIWALSSVAISNQNMSNLKKGVLSTASNIRKFYGDREIKNDNAAMNNNDLVVLNLVAPEILSNGAIRHNLNFSGNGPITISYDATCKSLNANSFAIFVRQLNPDACNQLTADIAGSNNKILNNGIAQIFIGNASQKAITNAKAFDQATVQKSCVRTDKKANPDVKICFNQ